MKKIMLCYPPGDLSKKIKNRYRFYTKDIVPHSMRACNDLGYMAATLRNDGHDVFLFDYKITNSTALDFLDDILKYCPDVIVLKTDIANIFEDLKLVRMIKSSNPQIVVVLKSEMFFDASEDLLCNLPLGGVDYLIGSDAAFVMPLIVKYHFDAKEMIYQIPFITICQNGCMQKTNFHAPHGNINDLPFPARDLMKNEYYYRPDNKEVIATIHTAKGCNCNCLGCFEPVLADSTLNVRSAKNVFDEVYECFSKYGIRSFYFPSDTFTHSEKWVEEFCDLIINSEMSGNIDLIIHVNPANFTEYMAMEMKGAGCSIVVMRFDCGSDDSLLRMNKGLTIDECYNSAEIADKNKLKIFAIYSLGLPWEEEAHLVATQKMMNKIAADYIIISMPVPLPNSKIEKIFRDENILKEPVVTKDGIKIPALGTKFLTHRKVRKFRRQALLFYYLHPKFVFKKLLEISKKPELFKKYMAFLFELFTNKRK